MRTLKITRATLEKFGACSSGLHDFAAAYPRGVTVTDDQLVNADLLAALWTAANVGCRCNVCKPHHDGNAQSAACNRVEWFCYVLGYHGGTWHEEDLFHAAGLLADAVGVYLTRKKKR